MSMASSGIASMSMDHVIPPPEVIAYWAEKESSKLGKSAKFMSSDQAGVVEVEFLLSMLAKFLAALAGAYVASRVTAKGTATSES